ncbi:MAG: folylpolyglutamate synthase/dihydrofolate synthase family protein [Rhodospirillaceae bacterium]
MASTSTDPRRDPPTTDLIDPVLTRLQRLHPKIIDLSLGRVQRLLAALDNPQNRLPPVVHVAGTNGKGSTIAFLRAFLEAAGLQVHVYTSPHLVRFHERIRLGAPGGGRLITDAALLALLEECERLNTGQPITFFEITTAAAFLAFARTPADIVLLETGLGGRLDATNLIDRPAVTAITRISYDHMQYLGPTLTDIAGEKAGILKQGVSVVLSPQPETEAREVLLNRAAALGAPALDWRIDLLTDGGFHFESALRNLNLLAPTLPGAHQFINAGTAIACLDALTDRFTVRDEAIRRGLTTVSWPARLQRLRSGPLIDALPADWELWLDGGHNDSAGEVLAAWASAKHDMPLVLIFGMLNTKRPTDFLAPLARYAERLVAVPIPGEHAALPASEAAQAARDAGFNEVSIAENPLNAIIDLRDTLQRRTRILICGSLYLAGSVLMENG